MLLSHRMNGWNDQEQQWNRMRSVVCCDVINLLAFVIHNGRPQRYAVLPRLEMLAWSFAIHLSLRLSLPNLPPYLPLFSIQILIQFAHQRKLTNALRESIDVDPCMAPCHESALLPLSCAYPLLTASPCLPPAAAPCPQVTSYLVSSQSSHIMCCCVNRLGVDAAVSALTRPVIEY